MSDSLPQKTRDPKVSVVMPFYNCERYIGRALESILNQTLRDFELILIDDASTDSSAEVVKPFLDDSRIVYLRNDRNLGIGASRNIGTRTARAPLIAVADADDTCDPRRLEIQVGFLERNPAIGAVASFLYIVDTDGQNVGMLKTPVTEEEIRKELKVRMPLPHPTLVIRKDLIAKIGGYRDKFPAAVDYDMLLRLSEHTKLATIPQPLYCYRLSPDGITIRKRGIQKFCLAAAWRFAEERAQTGTDSYNESLTEELLQLKEERQSKKAIDSRYHLFVGKLAAAAGNIRLARSHFLRSIRSRPFQLASYLFILLSLPGSKVYRAVQQRLGTTQAQITIPSQRNL